MYQISVEEAPDQFETLVQTALLGEEVVITQEGKPIIKWIAIDPPSTDLAQIARPRFGSGKHLNITMSDDFDEPLEDFAEIGEENTTGHAYFSLVCGG